MSVNNKRKLSIVVYYTLVVLTIAFAAFFGYSLLVSGVAMWARVLYFIWAGLVVGVAIFDIICTSNNEAKIIAGSIVYGLSVIAVIMAIVLYFVNMPRTGLVVDFFAMFIPASLLSFITSGLLIATWCVGESLVEHKTALNEMANK